MLERTPHHSWSAVYQEKKVTRLDLKNNLSRTVKNNLLSIFNLFMVPHNILLYTKKNRGI